MGVNAANRSPSRDAHAPRFMLLLLALLLPMFLLFIFILEEGGGVQCKDNCDSSIVVNGPPCIAIASNAAPPGEAVVVPLTNDDSRADASRTSAALTIRSTVLLMALAGVLLLVLLFADNAGLGISFFSTWLNTLPLFYHRWEERLMMMIMIGQRWGSWRRCYWYHHLSLTLPCRE